MGGSGRLGDLSPLKALRSLTGDRRVASVSPPMRQLSALVVVAACLAGCRGEPRPVARLGVEPHTVRLGFPELREVHFNWQPMSALGDGGAPVVFVHLLDRQGKVLRTFDHPFPGAWQEGVPASYDVKLYQSALAKPLAPGPVRGPG